MLFKRYIPILAIGCLLQACDNNTTTAQQSAGDTLAVATVDSVFIPIYIDAFLPCEQRIWNIIPEYDSAGKEGALQLGNVGLFLKYTGRDEFPIGDYNMYDFRMLLNGKEVWKIDHILGPSEPLLSKDSLWLTIQFFTYPGEAASQTSLYLFDIARREPVLIDTNLYTYAGAQVLNNKGKVLVFYFSGDALCCFDLASNKVKEIAYLHYLGFTDPDEVVASELSEVVLQNGKLSGKLTVRIGDERDEPSYRCGRFAITFPG